MQRAPILASLALFVLACCLPALEFHNSGGANSRYFGGGLLAIGWLGLFAGVWGWFANPLWLAGVVLGFLRKPVWAAACGGAAILVALTTFSLFTRDIPGDEGDVTHLRLLRLLPAFYLWIASMAVLPLLVFFRRPK